MTTIIEKPSLTFNNVTPIHALAAKKTLPDASEMDAINELRKIRAGRSSGDEIKLSGRWLETASYLLEAYQRGREPGFWNAYEALAVDDKKLAMWRDIVEIDAPLEESQSEPKPDKRFIVEGETKRLKLSSIEDIYQIPDGEYLVAKVLETASVSLLYGPSGTGKTFTGLNLALSVAHGLYWFGRKTKPGPVWFVNTEGGRGLKKRLKAWYIEHDNLTPSDNFKIIPWSLDLRGYLDTIINTLEYARQHNEIPVLIVLDNFSMCVPGIDQNKQDQVSTIFRDLHNLTDEYGSHIMLVHHTNKDGDFNGTMAFRNHVDLMIELKKEDRADKTSPIIFSCQKSRDDEPFSDIRTSLKTVNLYYDESEQDYVTSCVVVSCDSAAPEKTTPELELKTLEILNVHGQLNCSQWSKLALEIHGVARASFYRILKRLKDDQHVWAMDEKKNGSKIMYALSDIGKSLFATNQTSIKPVSPVSNQYHDTGDTAKKPVSPVSHPFRGDTGETGFLATPNKLFDSGFSGNETLEEPDYIQDGYNSYSWDRED